MSPNTTSASSVEVMNAHLDRVKQILQATEWSTGNTADFARIVGHWPVDPAIPAGPEEQAWRQRQARHRLADLQRRREAAFAYRRAKLVAASTSC